MSHFSDAVDDGVHGLGDPDFSHRPDDVNPILGRRMPKKRYHPTTTKRLIPKTSHSRVEAVESVEETCGSPVHQESIFFWLDKEGESAQRFRIGATEPRFQRTSAQKGFGQSVPLDDELSRSLLKRKKNVAVEQLELVEAKRTGNFDA